LNPTQLNLNGDRCDKMIETKTTCEEETLFEGAIYNALHYVMIW